MVETSPERQRTARPATALLALALAAGCGSAGSPSPRPDGDRATVRVGIVGDQTYSPDLDAAYAVLAAGVERLGRLDLDVVLHVGDLVESTREPERVRGDFARAAAILDRLPVPWYLAAGDHDVNPPEYRPGSADRSRERLFRELYGARVPSARERLWYGFDAGGVHFVALYSHQALHADPRFGDVFLARVGADQLAWLEADLAAQAGRPVVVFLHQPLWYHWSGWQPVHELLRRHRVVAVVSGHLHYDQAGGRLDGIEYLTVGATGGALKEASRDAGGAHHVSVLEVDRRGRVALSLLPLDGGPPLAPTPRADMDRVQAVDLVLGALFDFAAANPVLVRDGELVRDCATREPAILALTALGNPLDVPLDLEVAFTAEPAAVTLAGAAFAPGACDTPAAGRCRLAAAARTRLANTSSVEIDPALPALWTARAAAGGPVPPPPGTRLELTVGASFAGTAGRHTLTRTAAIAVAACP